MGILAKMILVILRTAVSVFLFWYHWWL